MAPYPSASRAAEVLSGLIFIADHIARAPHRVDQRLREALVHGLTQPAHVHIDEIGLRIELQIPHPFEQHGARHHLVCVAHQELQQLELAGGALDFLAGAHHRAAEQVHLQIRHPQPCLGHILFGGAAPKQRFDPGQQLREGERLGEIIIAAGLEAQHAIIDGPKRAQDQYRGSHALFAQRPHHAQTIQMRQHAIGDQEVKGLFLRLFEPFAPIDRQGHGVTALLQPFEEKLGGLQVIFDQQQIHVGVTRRPSSWRTMRSPIMASTSAPHHGTMMAPHTMPNGMTSVAASFRSETPDTSTAAPARVATSINIKSSTPTNAAVNTEVRHQLPRSRRKLTRMASMGPSFFTTSAAGAKNSPSDSHAAGKDSGMSSNSMPTFADARFVSDGFRPVMGSAMANGNRATLTATVDSATQTINRDSSTQAWRISSIKPVRSPDA